MTIRAVATTPEDAVALADAVPPELNAYLQERVQARMATERDALVKRLADLRSQQRVFDATLADPTLDPNDRETTEAERDAVVNQYRLAYDRFTRLADSESVPQPLTTLDPGRPFPITRAEYDAALARAQTGDNHRQQTPTDTPTDAVATAAPSRVLDGPIARAIVGALFGLCLALMYVGVRGRFDTRIHERPTIEASLGAPVLADIPNLSRDEVRSRAVLTRDAPLSSTAEAYRSIRASLLLVKPELERRGARGLVVMVASPKPGEGKTLSTANLAVALAETGLSVLAVNCDFRRPVLGDYFGVEPQPATVVPAGLNNLSVVTNVARDPGANPAKAVAAQRALVDWARPRYDVVLLDTAPLLVTNDAVDLLPAADVVAVVVRQGRTKSGDLERTRELLERHGARVAGAIANCVDTATSSYYYYARDIAKVLPPPTAEPTAKPPASAPDAKVPAPETDDSVRAPA